mmetsp:Transcript_3638/g.8345  ORF Transcript_3638/g.8345 Transcript_3638/m.8345 type:complete len:482 (+) Transcript_3638:90-1535(+)
MDVPIVQGTAVPAGGEKYADNVNQQNNMNNQNQDNEFSHLTPSVRPEMQASGYRDVGWAGLFVVHLIVMVAVISVNMGSGAAAAANGNGGVAEPDYSGIYYLVGITAVSTIALGSATLQFMMRYPEELVKGSLVITVALSGVIAILGLMSGQMFAGIMGVVFFAIGVCYAKSVWPRIPFAAANLNTALTAVKANMGVTIIAYGMVLLAFGWSILWFIGVGDSLSSNNTAVVFFLLVSFYWVQQVLSNTVQTTVAGTIGTWWFVPDEASSYWSSAIKDSFGRATTYSFGSICFGSFIVAVVQALRAIAHQARQNEDAQLLVCIIDCILGCIQDILEYINKWAYVYVGLYGFGYIEAGKNVLELFKSKGWDVIIADDLCDRVLFMVSLGIGVFTGIIGLVCTYLNSNLLVAFDLGEATASAGFFVGLVVGFVFCSILMNVVGGAVNTVIVCYAESPAEFQTNHPALAHQMRSAYMQAFPELRL